MELFCALRLLHAPPPLPCANARDGRAPCFTGRRSEPDSHVLAQPFVAALGAPEQEKRT
jgi:hypothetical protein